MICILELAVMRSTLLENENLVMGEVFTKFEVPAVLPLILTDRTVKFGSATNGGLSEDFLQLVKTITAIRNIICAFLMIIQD